MNVTEWPAQPLEWDRTVPGPDGGHAWIQWKGTNVCMDVRCRCGASGHIDDDFTYFYRCTNCGDTFCVGQTVRLYPIEPDKVGAIASECCTCQDASAEHHFHGGTPCPCTGTPKMSECQVSGCKACQCAP